MGFCSKIESQSSAFLQNVSHLLEIIEKESLPYYKYFWAESSLSLSVFICHKRWTGVLGLGETSGRGGGGGGGGGGDEVGGGGGGEETGEGNRGWRVFSRWLEKVREAPASPHGNWEECQQLPHFKQIF